MKVTATLLFCGLVAASCHASPLPNYGGGGSSYGGVKADVFRSGGSTFGSVSGHNTWKFDEGTLGIAGSHQREFGQSGLTTGSISGGKTWEFDRSAINLGATHQREIGGNKDFQTNVGASGSYDVFDNGRTKGTIFGGLHRNWDTAGPDSKGYEYGGKIEHVWKP